MSRLLLIIVHLLLSLPISSYGIPDNIIAEIVEGGKGNVARNIKLNYVSDYINGKLFQS